ncbi:MAG: hypothetical protein C4570_02455 [Ammonifex sp.]|nr:MAG: hypothetical protein C4570_02455 [Ammonifex sp.]
MNHTFLFQPATWTAKGTFTDADGNTVPVDGETTITHEPEVWVNEGYMRLLDESGLELQNRYEIVPFAEGKDFTSWKSFNPALGVLIGAFSIVDDSIISISASEDGQYYACEYLLKIDDGNYRGRGVLFRSGEKLSSWAVDLAKED